ncbi:DUF427 domain-containing protein [Streptomyces chartreusis]|uniref:DUF427 domain-containing protein n=1 Tax=Streptomyces chartreusis TaxID=1969 RepID=UPI0037F5DDCA
MLLHEPGRYPVAHFLLTDVAAGVLEQAEHTTQHRDLGAMSWYPVRAGGQSKQRSAWQHVVLPDHAEGREGRVAFAHRAVDGFFDEHERIVGHVADACRRMDIPSTNRHLVVRNRDQVVADSKRPLVLYESGMQLLRHRQREACRVVVRRCLGRGAPRLPDGVFRAGRDRGVPRRRAAETGARAERGLARRKPQPRPR